MITLNGTPIPQQPSGLNEAPSFVKTDTSAIDGSKQRMQYPSTKRVQMTFDVVLPATFRFIKELYDSATAVTYRNDQSNVGTLEFSGIMSYSQGEYLRGGSLMVSLTVTIEEGQPFGEEPVGGE
jgi:hypothetical protein